MVKGRGRPSPSSLFTQEIGTIKFNHLKLPQSVENYHTRESANYQALFNFPVETKKKM